MDIQTVVQSWIHWSEQHLPMTGDIPKINIEDPVPPWIEDPMDTLDIAIGQRELLLTCFMNYLVDDPLNIPARFTALAVYYPFSGRDRRYAEELRDAAANLIALDSSELEMVIAGSEDYEDLAGETEKQADKLVEGFDHDLGLLVRQLRVEEIPNDWRVIRWEILNSYAISDWKRALKLYSIAEESNLLDLCDLQLIRGQFRYLLVFGPKLGLELESLWWEPKLVGADDPESLVLLISGLRFSQFKPELTESTIDTLRDASNDLEKALNKRPKLSPLYGPMLARCYFSTGRLHDAAVIYEQALTEWAMDGIRQGIRQWIYESLRTIYQESRLPEKTIELLERWAAEFPDEKGIHMQIAELQAQLANMEAVPISVRKEVERNPEADRDWRITTLLALGETRDVSEKLLSELESDPAKFNLITSLLQDYWPIFAGLSKDARNEWTIGIYLRNHSVPQLLRAVWSGKAGHAHANAVELELNSRVFSRFRESVLAAQAVNEFASGATDPKDESYVILRYIRKDRPYDKRSLTLGEMVFIIDRCERSQVSILKKLKIWIEKNCPRLFAQEDNLYKVNKFRTGPAHGNAPEIPGENIPFLCRQIIESLPEQPREQA
jgi:tetratricopeptide (TPR) repeat protein